MFTRGVFILSITGFLIIYSNAKEKLDRQINDIDADWPVKVIKCFHSQYALKCFERILDERSKSIKRAPDADGSVTSRKAPSEVVTLKKFSELMDKWRNSLAVHIRKEVSVLLKNKGVTSMIRSAVKYFSTNSSNDSVSDKNQTATARKMKMNMNMKNMLPYMLVPGLWLAGIMPWIVPQIKMLVMTVAMLNQAAFSAALFSLIRGYVFDTEQKEHIFYINHGYKQEKHYIEDHLNVNKDDLPTNNTYL